jgi:DNA-binding CsgD family transcriptional regulator
MDLSSRMDLAGGRDRRARARAEYVWKWEGLRGVPVYRIMVRETMALLAWSDGDMESARGHLAEQLDDAEDQGNGHARSLAHLYLGAIDREAGAHRSAEDHFHEALRGAVELGFLGDAAALLRELAGLAADVGRFERAAQLIGAANTVDRGLGISFRLARQASFDRDRATISEALGEDAWSSAHASGESLSLDDAVALVTRARGERDRPRFGWESLTPTERQVVDLIRRGATNAVVADRLLMGRETVKTHLSSIYRKLDVANRTELAAFAATAEPRTD